MNLRSGIATAVVSFGVLATATGCGGSSKAAVLPSPNAAAISTYVSMMRSVTAVQQSDAQRFSPKETSDAQLIAIGEETCADLQSHKPPDVMSMLEAKGWSPGDAVDLIIGAADVNTLCPGDQQAVKDWSHDVFGG